MIEERLERINSEIKQLKSSMPVAGSLLDTYFYTHTATATYNDGVQAKYKIKYTPVFQDEGLGMTEVFVYCEANTSDPDYSQDNPIYLSVEEGYYVESGSATNDDYFTATGFGTYEVKITVAVYSTVPGTIEILFL